MLLRDYATGRFSYRDVANRINAQGYRTRNRRAFTEASIRDVLGNRFYEGKVVYHQGLPDELVTDGIHELPREVKDLWLKCQEIKERRRNSAAGHPRGPSRHFPLTRVLSCHRCGNPYHGEAVRNGNQVDLRLSHHRRGPDRHCSIKPRSQSVPALVEQMGQRVMPYIKLDSTWKTGVLAVLRAREPQRQNQGQPERLQQALENLRKQHQWGDLSDDDYRREREPLERQLKVFARPSVPPQVPNLERAAKLLADLPALWLHPGVTHEQRENLVREVFHRITIDGKEFVSIEPQPAYVPLFATMVVSQKLGYREPNSPPSPPETRISRLRLKVSLGRLFY